MVPTAANWSDWVGVMVTSHFGLILGLLWAKKGLFWPKIALMGPKRAHLGPKFQIVLNLSSDPSKHAREGHSADEKNFVPIWFTSSEKIPKKYQLWQFCNFCEVFFLGGGVCWVAWSGLRRQIGRNLQSQFFWRNIHLCGFSNDACSMVNEIISNIALHQQIRIYCLCCLCIAARQIKFT